MAKIEQVFGTDEVEGKEVTFHKDSTILVDAAAFSVPAGLWCTDDSGSVTNGFIRFAMAKLLQVAFDGKVRVDTQAADEGSAHVWYCYFNYRGVQCRLVAEHELSEEATLGVQATLTGWDTCSKLFTKKWAGRCHPLGWLRNAHENTLGTLSWFLVKK